MADPAAGASAILVTAGVGTAGATSGWGIFLGRMPSKPDTVVVVKNAGGLPPNPKWRLDYPSLQVLVRGAANDRATAFTKAKAVKDALLGYPSGVVGGVGGDTWVQVLQMGDIAEIGYDENNRPLLSLNFSLIVEPTSGTNRVSL